MVGIIFSFYKKLLESLVRDLKQCIEYMRIVNQYFKLS